MEKKEIISQIKKAKNKNQLYKIPRTFDFGNKCRRNNNLNVVIVALPCHGYGDVIFSSKFANYLKKYSKRITILTSSPEMFQKLKVTSVKIQKVGTGSRKQCRRLRNYKRPRGLGKIDLIFIAPLISNFEIDYGDVKEFLKESTPFNTIFLSEYQDTLSKGFDIPTGIGKGYYGLLFDGTVPSKKLKTIGNIPYALAYIASGYGVKYCMSNFAKMVVKKYHKKYSKFQIVMSQINAEELFWSKSFRRFAKKYYSNIILKTKKYTESIQNSNSSTLLLRGDILPVKRKDMLSLMKYSVEDILVTGDQSITDVIDCCPNKTIWYQIVPWKKNFANQLAKELPQKYLRSAKTSCGTLKAVKWHKKKSNFKLKNDFLKNAKPVLDRIFCTASKARNKNSLTYKYLNQLKKSNNKTKLIEIIKRN